MIELRNITKTVRSGAEDLTILADVSMTIPSGQFVALTGASGSGKSTLLGLIAGLDAPSSGIIAVDGEEITSMGEDGLARIRSGKIPEPSCSLIAEERRSASAIILRNT